MSNINRIVALPYLNAITPSITINGTVLRPAAALIEGAPGIGKTAMNTSAMRTIKADFRTVILSTHEPPDIGGYPWPDKDRVKFLPAEWFVEARDASARGERVVIFFDEYNWASPQMQAASMRPILEGVPGADPDLVRFLVAMNPSEFAEGVYDTIDPLRNRVTHYKVEDPGAANYVEFLSGALDESVNLPVLDREQWDREWARQSALITSYLRARPGALCESPAKARGRKFISYATRRSWTSMALLLTTCKVFGWDWARHDVACGSIGEPNALEYLQWERVMDLGDPEEFLKDPKTVPFDQKRDDRMFAILSAICAAATTQQKTKERYAARWEAAWECIDALLQAGMDKALATVAVRTLIHRNRRPQTGSLSPLVRRIAALITPLTNLVMEGEQS